MAFASSAATLSHFDFSRPASQLSLDRSRPSALFDDSADVLVDDFLDSSIMSPAVNRRDSFSHHATVFSPDTSLLDDFTPASTNPFFGANTNTNNPFTRLEPSQAAVYGQQPSTWPFEPSEPCPPPSAGTYEGFPATDFDSIPPATPFTASAVPNGRAAVPFHALQAPVFPSDPTTIERSLAKQAPEPRKDWMAMAAQDVQSRPLSKRMRPGTPPRSFEAQRRDGIRKKNARFEIPAERSLHNIDQLIAESSNEDEIKELKQQKRLLRNRQAALDSRQRKKKHTEELEEEKKMYTERFQMLEDELNSLRLDAATHMREKEQWHHQHAESQQTIRNLQWEQEELVRKHTLETGELRKRVSILMEKLENAAVSATPTSSGLPDFASDTDSFAMVPIGWDDYFLNDFSMESGDATPVPTEQQQPTPPNETALVIASKKESVPERDRPVASGLLLMLLLCGAFVASKSSGSSPPAIPRMPDELRAASATVLDSIFKDAGVATTSVSTPNSLTATLPTRPRPSRHGLAASREAAARPAPSNIVTWPKLTLSETFATSSLDQLHDDLANPTSEQQAEQIFGMTPAQYNSITSVDFSRRAYGLSPGDEEDGEATPISSPSAGVFSSQEGGHRRNLAETLAAMREQAKGQTAAEVYTRSLLWDKIPSEVVLEFKRMVEESGAAIQG